jgi:trans-2,3-dihydro-3-hydroxyanthranilate isomerase
MRAFRFMTVDVFTDVRFGGNPLAVFPQADGLSDDEMQALAAEFNLSETAFVMTPADPARTARVRIFNRTEEMPFAGHPNVGTAWVLAHLGLAKGDQLEFEEIAGIVRVRIERDETRAPAGAVIEAPQPLSLGETLDAGMVASCAGLGQADIEQGDHPPVIASMGNPFVIARTTPEALARARPDIAAFREAAAARPSLSSRLALHLYAHDGDGIRARMFAPLAGTMEDPATGSANAPLAGLLLSLGQEKTRSFTIRQGVEMGRPSLLRVTARRGLDGIRAEVGGDCVPVLKGEALV